MKNIFILIQIYTILMCKCDDTEAKQNQQESHLDDDGDDNIYNNYKRTKRFLNPNFDWSDPFNFLKDQYSLPEGLYAPLDEYDFVIVGAGASGCVLANRLSEVGKWSVLLLEVGGGENFLTEVPIIAAHFQHTLYNWGYRQEKQDGLCMGMEEQRCSWPRGRAVGGSSVINYMIYTRGHKRDWDSIAAAGNPGWSYDEVMPYFLKSERAQLKGLENSTNHNKDGLMSVEFVKFRTPLADAFIDAGNELGIKTIEDYNQGDKYGFSYVQAQTIKARRHSAARAFLLPFKNRNNLHILPYSRVTKINIDPETKQAYSVEYVRNRKRYTVKAKKEIILSAGAFSSPQLLMLSGVGPKDHLEELDIDVIKDLRVGENMYDHISYVGLVFHLNVSGTSFIESNFSSFKYYKPWVMEGDGPLGLIGGVEALGYIKTNVSNELDDYPDVELIFAPGGLTADKSNSIRKSMKISDEFFNEVFEEIVERECWTVSPMLLHPKSKGYIKLKDKNPFHWPKFYYDYFSDKKDLDTLVEGIKFVITLSKTQSFQKYGSKLYAKHFPTCKEHTFGTDKYWECAARTLGTTLHHQIATCKMGPHTDPEAVVDSELKVHGISRLRVADTSIIPKPLTAHVNAPAIMIGEKLADILKNTWNSDAD